MYITAIMAVLPILLALFLLLKLGIRAHVAAFWALVLTCAEALLWCGTSPGTMLKAGLSGAVGSLPIILVMYASMFQITVMNMAGAIDRFVALMKTIAPGQQATQLILINIGFGILFTSLGATTMALFPPIMMALGYSAFVSIALPCIGYEALCSYALLGVPVVVFSGLSGYSVPEAGMSIAVFMPIMSVCISVGMLWLAGGFKLMRQGFVPALIAGLAAGFVPVLMAPSGMVAITGIIAGAVVVFVLLLYLKLRGHKISDPSILTPEDRQAMSKISLLKALSPWIILIVASMLVNAPFLPLFKLAFVDLAMPLELIPQAPERLRIFWQPWFWVFVSTLLAAPILKVSYKKVALAANQSFKRSLRPCLAAVLFFSLAYIMNHSGKNADWSLLEQSNNMVEALAAVSSSLFGALYPLFAPFLGLAGGFIAGSQSSAFAMFTGLHLSVADTLQASGLVVAAGSGIGGGLASILSASKVLLAGAAIDKPEVVAPVMRKALPLVLIITLILGGMTLYLAY